MLFDSNEWLTTKQYAEKVGAPAGNIPYYIRTLQLKARKDGRDWRIHIDCVKDWPFEPKKRTGRKKKEFSREG